MTNGSFKLEISKANLMNKWWKFSATIIIHWEIVIDVVEIEKEKGQREHVCVSVQRVSRRAFVWCWDNSPLRINNNLLSSKNST